MSQTVQTVQSDIKAVKTGYKTSEFWFHLIIQVFTWVGNLNANTSGAHLALTGLSVLSLLGYTTSRTIVKK